MNGSTPKISWPTSRHGRNYLPNTKIRRPRKYPVLSSPTLHTYYLKLTTGAKERLCGLSQSPNFCESTRVEESVVTGIDHTGALERPFKLPVARRRSLYRTPTRTYRIRMTRTALARVCRTMVRVRNDNRPGGYLAYSKEEIRSIVREPVSDADYQEADRIARNLGKARRRLNPVVASLG